MIIFNLQQKKLKLIFIIKPSVVVVKYAEYSETHGAREWCRTAVSMITRGHLETSEEDTTEYHYRYLSRLMDTKLVHCGLQKLIQ